jgi:hypothetical protein
MTRLDLNKLQTKNVWFVTLHSTKLTGKLAASELGLDWVKLVPFDNPKEMLEENHNWNCLDIPCHVYIPDIRLVYELYKNKIDINDNKTS